MPSATILARGHSDAEDRLVSADELLADLHLRCGGTLPGTIAIPALYELVRKSREFGLKLARAIKATDGEHAITAWVEVEPGDAGGCNFALRSWQAEALPAEDLAAAAERREAISRTVAELTARLDVDQAVLAVEAQAADLAHLAETMRGGLGRPWTDFVTVEGGAHHQPLHWRLLDGAAIRVPGSDRSWRAVLLPSLQPGGEPAGFELCLTADAPPPAPPPPADGPPPARESGLLSREIAPVLRQPIARIIANAETIRTRMAGPLAEEYSNYAADIAAAGQHLLALVEDLADLDVVEADDFDTARDRIDLADAARRAAGILAVRAAERGITIDAPRHGEHLPAIAEFRRVLQILLNLLGNAIRYSPDRSQIWIRLEQVGARAQVVIADQGPGLAPDQHERVFDKFERLGRSDEGGTGLGLYISRRLARAMGGDLTVESARGQGARFILELPADLPGAA